jgi:quercetin 2,3-dioxygenase
VLQGAFEVQYKLMETRDGLALWNAKEIEIEALSNEAIIMLIEMDLKNN